MASISTSPVHLTLNHVRRDWMSVTSDKMIHVLLLSGAEFEKLTLEVLKLEVEANIKTTTNLVGIKVSANRCFAPQTDISRLSRIRQQKFINSTLSNSSISLHSSDTSEKKMLSTLTNNYSQNFLYSVIDSSLIIHTFSHHIMVF